jgi:hypothetical protein
MKKKIDDLLVKFNLIIINRACFTLSKSRYCCAARFQVTRSSRSQVARSSRFEVSRGAGFR